jgi:hypothetical protein
VGIAPALMLLHKLTGWRKLILVVTDPPYASSGDIRNNEHPKRLAED